MDVVGIKIAYEQEQVDRNGEEGRKYRRSIQSIKNVGRTIEIHVKPYTLGL